jgi:hypothetical protein
MSDETLPDDQPAENEIPPADQEKRFSQADVSVFMQKYRKGLQAKAKKTDILETENEQLKKRLAELEQNAATKPTASATPNPYGNSDGNGEESDTYISALETMADRDEEDDRVKELETRLREQERDFSLYVALSESQCIDVSNAVKLFRNDCVWDDSSNSWTLGNQSIAEHISTHLPDYLKRASMNTGGSGATESYRRPTSEIELEEKKLEQLKKQAERTRTNTDIIEYEKQRKRVAILKDKR